MPDESIYRIDQCFRCGRETWCDLHPTRRKMQCRACRCERFIESLYQALGLTLCPWNRDWIRDVFRPLKDDGRRLVTKSYTTMAKKNGKSFFVGALVNHHLMFDVDIEPAPLEAYGAAAAKGQAGIVFRSAAAFVEQVPALAAELRVLKSTKHIYRKDGRGFYAVISADGDLNDGVAPSFVCKDELHRWKRPKAAELYTVLSKGKMSRHQPLDVEITTRGAEGDCPLWERRDEHARWVRDGIVEDSKQHVMIFCADDLKDQANPEYWQSLAARVAANPSHEDHGGFLLDEAICEDMNEAIAHREERAKFKRFNLNLQVAMREERVIDLDRWRECADPGAPAGAGVDLRTWPTYDYELLVEKWGLRGQSCFAGVDLSVNTDLTALALPFPPLKDKLPWTILVFCWMPEAKVMERVRSDRVPYDKWVERGFVETCPGEKVRYEYVLRRIRWARSMFNLMEVCWDPWNAREAYDQLEDEGFTCVEVGQTIPKLTEATKKLLGLYVDLEVRHGNHPVLDFAARNLAVIRDKNDNMKPAKPDRDKTGKRIDPVSATITGMTRAVGFQRESKAGFMSVG